MLKGKHIILGITGSIAAYKAAYLLRLLIKRGAEVQVVMTPSGKEFITPVTLSSLSGSFLRPIPANGIATSIWGFGQMLCSLHRPRLRQSVRWPTG